MPQAKWKRRWLFILSLFGLIVIPFVFYISEDPSDNEPLVIILTVILMAMFILGLIVSVIGCSKCVARLFGNA